MSRPLVFLIYNIVLPVFFVFAFPAWLIKMWRRGGYGTGLRERFAIFDRSLSSEPKDTIYVHAVSVGEVLIALKLITKILENEDAPPIVLAATTSTGHAVAREKAPGNVRIVYSPLDFTFIVRAFLDRFTPRKIVLIEAEAWPNQLRIAQKKNIPVYIVNARLSERSEGRFRKFGSFIKPIFEMITRIGVQDEGDRKRFEALGIAGDKIRTTGSIKFDSSGGQVADKRKEFQDLLDDFGNAGGNGRPVLLVASTHSGEEKVIADAVKKSGVDMVLVVVPRHAERRSEVMADLTSVGFEPVLKTDYHAPDHVENACLVADTTGELRDWTAHANWVVIGKSWLGEGGQNPAEAIAAGIPVICGPNMGNFQPLVSQLCEQEAIVMLENANLLADTLSQLASDDMDTAGMVARARDVLAFHDHALEKTLELLEVNASVRGGNRVEKDSHHE